MIDSSSGDGAGGEERPALTAGAVAQAVGGTLRGDPGLPLTGLAPLDRAARTDISFLAAPKYAPLAARSNAGLVLVSPDLAEVECGAAATVVVSNPHEAILALIPRFHREVPAPAGVHPSARLGRAVVLGGGVSVGANAVLGDGVVLGDRVVVGANVTIGDGVHVGDESRIYPNVTIYPGSLIGRRVFIHAGARIGSDGFGYVYRDGAHRKIPHVGRCIVEDDVEIGANTTIDRGSIDDTVIGAGTKIDNLVQVGHNVRIGRLCLVAAQAGIAGSARIEDGAVIGGQVGLAGHLTIGKGAKLAAQAGVFGDIPAGETWSGYPARPHREALRAQAALFKLPSLLRRIERLLEGKDGAA